MIWPDKVAVVRDDNDLVLGAVHPKYETVQNSELKALVEPLIEEGLLEMANIGYLNDGDTVFVQAKVNKEFKIVGEEYTSYITLTNGHIGNSSVKIGPTTVRIICSNTFAMANSQIGNRFRHREGVGKRILECDAVSKYVSSSMDNYAKDVEVLCAGNCSRGSFQNAIETIYKKKADELRFYEKLEHLFLYGAGNSGKTYYDAFNAITDYNTNQSKRTSEGRFFFSNFGAGYSSAAQAMKVLSSLAQ